MDRRWFGGLVVVVERTSSFADPTYRSHRMCACMSPRNVRVRSGAFLLLLL